jgi:transposase
MINTNWKNKNKAAFNKKATAIKLGIDVHADTYVVVRQIDGAMPQPAQSFSPLRFQAWVQTQLNQAEQVHTCYEAGPFGYGLHRQLQAMGINNLVIRPQNWDEHGNGVKTDKIDALAMVQRLDRYVNGNLKALAVVNPPELDQELLRSQSRQREQFRQHRQRLEAQGRTMMLNYGTRVKGRWWQGAAWVKLLAQLPQSLLAMVSEFQERTAMMHTKVEKLTKQIEGAKATTKIKGAGALSEQILLREMVDWNRFTNRRQVASLTGLCPGVHSSGNKHRQGSITKHGKPRVRRVLIEMAWRVSRFQPDYQPVKKWAAALKSRSSAMKKKAIVAIARHLAIDLWRINAKGMDPKRVGLSLLA